MQADTKLTIVAILKKPLFMQLTETHYLIKLTTINSSPSLSLRDSLLLHNSAHLLVSLCVSLLWLAVKATFLDLDLYLLTVGLVPSPFNRIEIRSQDIIIRVDTPFSHKLFVAASYSLKASNKYIKLLQQCLKPPNSLTSSVLHVCCK